MDEKFRYLGEKGAKHLLQLNKNQDVRIENLINGTTPVAKSIHSETSDNATTSTKSNDSDLLQGFTAKQVGESGVRNLIPYPYYETTHTEDGITYTDNGDGTITANGTATARADFSFLLWKNYPDNWIKAGTYILSVNVNEKIGSLALEAWSKDDNSYVKNFGYAGHELAVPITITDEDIEKYYITPIYYINKGETVDNFVIKPMLELGSVAHDWRPYHYGGAEHAKSADNADTVGGLGVGSFFRKYGLNAINIDSTIGNWNTNVSDGNHGTLPVSNVWYNVTQFESDHFFLQIASDNNRNLTYTRTKYRSNGTWGAWKNLSDLNRLLNGLSTESSVPQDADYFISQYAGGGEETTTYHRRPVSALWSYMKSKANEVYVNSVGGYLGSSSTILEWANNPNGQYRKFIVDSLGYPSDAPVNAEGYLELFSDSEKARKKVVYKAYGSRICYSRDVWKGSWSQTSWLRDDSLRSGGTVSGNLSLTSSSTTKVTVNNTTTPHDITLESVSNSGNAGLYDYTHNKWLIKYDKDGNPFIAGENTPLHTGNSRPIVASGTAPTDTTAVWIDTTNKQIKIYINGAWTQVG